MSKKELTQLQKATKMFDALYHERELLRREDRLSEANKLTDAMYSTPEASLARLYDFIMEADKK